jgi:hypothetical protein
LSISIASADVISVNPAIMSIQKARDAPLTGNLYPLRKSDSL